MKIARFSTGQDARYGIVDGDELVVLAGDPMYGEYDPTGERIALDAATLLAPVVPRSKIVGVAKAFRAEGDDEHDGDDAPVRPHLFFKPNTAITAPGDAIRLPDVPEGVDVEGELAIVIGKVASRVSPDDWADVVFGYTIANDVTAAGLTANGEWAMAKGFDSFCPLGPVIETEFQPDATTIELSIDGESRGAVGFDRMVTPLPELIAAITELTTLLPGDVILTGAPAGPVRIEAGQRVDITVPGIGTLSNPAVPR